MRRLQELLEPLPFDEPRFEEHALDVRWGRQIAERAIELHADGWKAQVRSGDPAEKIAAGAKALARMREELERHLADCGFYVPFGPIRLAIVRKTIA